MMSRITKLELLITCVALIVLFLATKPPRRGQADVMVTPEVPVDMAMPTEQPADTTVPESDAPTFTPETSDDAEMPAPPAVKPPRMALVDTSDCIQLGYERPLRGQVSAEWVWNGVKMVPMKVCTVDEGNGVTSVWSFDSRGKAVIETADRPAQEP